MELVIVLFIKIRDSQAGSIVYTIQAIIVFIYWQLMA